MTVQVITQNSVAQNGTDTSGGPFTGVLDTEIRLDAPTTNFGTGTDLDLTKYAAGDHSQSLIKFDLSHIPANAVITSAILCLRFKASSGTSLQGSVRRLLRDWVVGESTYNIYSTGNNWTTAGALSDGNDRVGTATATTAALPGIGAWTAFEVAADVQAFIDGTPNYGWHLERTDAGEDAKYWVGHSSNSTDNSRPELVVTYHTSVPQPDFLFTLDQASGTTIVNYGTQATSYVIGTNVGAVEGTDWAWRPNTGPWLGRYEGITDGGNNMPLPNTAATGPGTSVAPENLMIGFYLRSFGNGGQTALVGRKTNGLNIACISPSAGGDFDIQIRISNSGSVDSTTTITNRSFNTYYMLCVSVDTSQSPAVITAKVNQETPVTNTISYAGQVMTNTWPGFLRPDFFTIYYGLDGYCTAYAHHRNAAAAWTDSDMASINADPSFITGWPSGAVVDAIGARLSNMAAQPMIRGPM